MSFILGPQPHVVPKNPEICVKEVRAYTIGSKKEEMESGGAADCHAQKHGHWIVDTPIANPMSFYEEYKASRTSWGIGAIGTLVVEVELNNGVTGFGVSIGGDAGCAVVEQHLHRFVEGQDIHNIELMWDQMWRSSVNYGRKGLVIQVISAIDLALWDCLGKLKNEPVYNLLGGKTKEKIPMYATTIRPDLAKEMGFQGTKVPLPYGPADGDAGMRGNIERLKQVREKIGPDFPLMVDCYMSLTVPYTIELARRIHAEVPGGVKWIEEFLPPDEYAGYAEVKRNVNTTLLTTGEHEYTRYGFRRLLENKCCDLLQPDVTWCGGITEARRVVAMASSYDIPCIPHGSSVYSYHLQFAFQNCPIAELIMMAPEADEIVPYFGKLLTDEPLPVNGYVDVPADKPGFGVTLNKEELTFNRPFTHEPESFDQIVAAKRSRSLPNFTSWKPDIFSMPKRNFSTLARTGRSMLRKLR